MYTHSTHKYSTHTHTVHTYIQYTHTYTRTVHTHLQYTYTRIAHTHTVPIHAQYTHTYSTHTVHTHIHVHIQCKYTYSTHPHTHPDTVHTQIQYTHTPYKIFKQLLVRTAVLVYYYNFLLCRPCQSTFIHLHDLLNLSSVKCIIFNIWRIFAEILLKQRTRTDPYDRIQQKWLGLKYRYSTLITTTSHQKKI